MGHWGDLMKCKQINCNRLLLDNTGGIGFMIGERSKETLKMEKLKQTTVNYDVNLICLTEINKDWRSMKQENTIWEGTKQK